MCEPEFGPRRRVYWLVATWTPTTGNEMIDDYHILMNLQMFDLMDAVKQHIRDGWEPLGGVAVMTEPDQDGKSTHAIYLQSLVKRSSG